MDNYDVNVKVQSFSRPVNVVFVVKVQDNVILQKGDEIKRIVLVGILVEDVTTENLETVKVP